MGGFPKEATHVSLRSHRRPMGQDRPLLPRPLPPRPGRPSLEGPPPPGQRHPLAPPHRRPLARHPRRYGPWQTVYDRFNRWRKDGTWAKILDALLLRLDRAGGIDRDLWCVDATISRAHASAAGAGKKSCPRPRLGGPPAAQVVEPEDHALGRSRGGFSTKVHLVCDSQGILLAVWVTAGQRHESRAFEAAMSRARRPRRAGRPTLAPAGGGRQGLQLPLGAAVAAAAAHRAGDPDAEGSAARRGIRQDDLSAAEHRRAGRGLVQVVPGAGDALRQAGGQLYRPVDHRQYPVSPAA